MFEVLSDTGNLLTRHKDFDDAVSTAEQIKNAFNAECTVTRSTDGFNLYDTRDTEKLKLYLCHSMDDWTGNPRIEHDASAEPSVYFDIDGTLGYWYPDRRGMTYPEEVLDPNNHYFLTIEEHPFMIALAKELQERHQPNWKKH